MLIYKVSIYIMIVDINPYRLGHFSTPGPPLDLPTRGPSTGPVPLTL
jgi:hypothetical protein